MYSKVIQLYVYIYVCVYIYIYVNIYILFQILFSYRLWQDIEHDSLCYGRSLLFIYFIYKINNNNNLNVKTRSFVVFAVQLPSHVWLFVTPRNCRHARPPCPSPSPSLPKCMSIESVMPSNHLILCHPLLLPSIFPESGSFPVSQLFALGGKSTVVSGSVSVLSMNTQDWFPLGWTGWISLQSKGLSRVFSTPQFKSTSSSALSFLYSQTLTCTHDHWEDHGLDCMGLCQQNEVFTF